MMPRTVIVGAGKVAWHFAHRLLERGVPIAQVVNRSEAPARDLAEAVGATYTIDFQEIATDAAWYILAVKDDALAGVAEVLARKNLSGLVAHTSGATPGSLLAPHFERWGVCWPLQSFSLGKKPRWAKTPVCVHAGRESDLLFLEKMTRRMGAKPYRVDDAQRAHLHIGAVFANNFANHCFAIAARILAEHGLPFALLHPIMAETVAKATANPPAQMQTGPAVRGDAATMRRQIALLQTHPDWQELYRLLSESIGVEERERSKR
ncbi:MAG: Rossmann-like and DUF2520 domain-containing protein [Saprospiraceae bacterium]